MTANGCDDLIPANLGPADGAATNNDVFTCTFTAQVAGAPNTVHSNTVTATMHGFTQTATETVNIMVADAPPSVNVLKSVAPLSLPEPGGTFTFTVEVQNTSGEDVALTSLTDSPYGNLLDPTNTAVTNNTCAGMYRIVAMTTFRCSFDVALSAVGDHTDTVTAVVTDNEDDTATGSAQATARITDVAPTLTVVKGGPASIDEMGGAATFTVDIANTSAEAVDLTALVDDHFGDLRNPANPNVTANSCTTAPAALAANDGALGGPDEFSCTFTATIAAGNAGGSHHNRVTVTFDDNDGADPYTAYDDHRVTYNNDAPTLSVDKTGPTNVNEGTQTANYTVTVVNTSTVDTVSISALHDSRFGNLDDGTAPNCNPDLVLPATLAIGDGVAGGTDTLVCTFSATITGNAGTTHDNTVTVTFDDNDGAGPYTDNDDHTVTFEDVAPTISVVKWASAAQAEPGGAFTFTVLVTNNSTEGVTVTSIDDAPYGNLLDAANPAVANNTCPTIAGDTITPGGGTQSCTFDVSYTNAGAYSDTVTVVVTDDEGSTGSDTDDATATVRNTAPTVTVDKSASAAQAEPGGAFTFTVLVTNNSTEGVTVTSIDDAPYGNLLDAANAAVANNTCPTIAGDTITPGGGTQSCTFDVSYTNAGAYSDTVTVVVTDDEGSTGSDTDDATATVRNTAPTVTVDKSANPTSVPETGGNVTYTVTATNTSAEAVTLTSLSDDVFGDLDGQGDCATGVSIAAGASYSCSFTKTIAGQPGNHTNVATAVVTDDDGSTGTGSNDAVVAIGNVAPTVTVDKSANPTSVPETGGNVTYTVTATNTSAEAVTLTSLSDDVR